MAKLKFNMSALSSLQFFLLFKKNKMIKILAVYCIYNIKSTVNKTDRNCDVNTKYRMSKPILL